MPFSNPSADSLKKTSVSPSSAGIVTGGCGLLGSHLSETLAREGYRVLAVDNLCTGSQSTAKYLKTVSGVDVLQGDVCQPWNWAKNWIDTHKLQLKYVFHFASPASPPHYQAMPIETLWVNSVGLDHALRFADSQSARVIFASTSEIYGDPEVHPQPESYWGNVNSYGLRACYDEAKRFGEALIYSHNRHFKKSHGLVRIFNTYGPRINPADGRVIINFLLQAMTQKPITIYGNGQQTRSFCYVSDLIEGIIRYAKSSLTEPVNIGNDREFTLIELVEIVQIIFPDHKLQVVHLPLPEDDPKQRRPDIRKAKELLKWEPKVDLATGLRLTKEWLQKELVASKS